MALQEHLDREAWSAEVADPTVSSLAPVIELNPPVPAEGFSLVHGKVRVPGAWHKIPYTASVAHEPTQEVSALIIPGLGGFKLSSRYWRNAMASEQGVTTISYDPGRFGGVIKDLTRAQQLHIDTIAAIREDLPNNEQFDEVPGADKLDRDKLILLPHSMGGESATEDALKHPEQTKGIVYVAPIGLHPAGLRVMAPNVPDSMFSEIIPGIIKREFGEIKHLDMALRTALYYGANFLRTTGEVMLCTQANLSSRLVTLEELGVPRGLLLGGLDKLIRAQKAAKHSAHLMDHHRIIDHFDHFAPQKRPSETAAHVADIIKLINV